MKLQFTGTDPHPEQAYKQMNRQNRNGNGLHI